MFTAGSGRFWLNLRECSGLTGSSAGAEPQHLHQRLQHGDYRTNLFINHNPEAWALADVVLVTAGLRVAG
ncbi:hypothetical protein Thiosp_04884 [Thiorhodovibrio litoralis]|nr:hypothetical protein [Thiorhodovibrio winogradskyi]WPL15022.1 hypothetical protein Thiosp_04884 [Thiorhodovibrio litoralis]